MSLTTEPEAGWQSDARAMVEQQRVRHSGGWEAIRARFGELGRVRWS